MKEEFRKVCMYELCFDKLEMPVCRVILKCVMNEMRIAVETHKQEDISFHHVIVRK